MPLLDLLGGEKDRDPRLRLAARIERCVGDGDDDDDDKVCGAEIDSNFYYVTMGALT